MKLKFIGTGGAFALMDRAQSNMLLTAPSGKKMLIDCGMTAPYKLSELGIAAMDIDAVYISHLHADHTGGMEWLGFMNFFTGSPKPRLFCERILMDQLWDRSLRGGMMCIQGKDARLETYFERCPIDMHDGAPFFVWEGYKFQLVQTLHVVGDTTFNPSFGLLINKHSEEELTYGGYQDNPKTTFITTDTQFTHPCPLQGFYDRADVIFHDCETGEGFKSGVHSHYDDMNQFMLPQNKSKTWLYHHSKERDSWEEDGFAGFVKTFDEFEL